MAQDASEGAVCCVTVLIFVVVELASGKSSFTPKDRELVSLPQCGQILGKQQTRFSKVRLFKKSLRKHIQKKAVLSLFMALKSETVTS